MTTTAKTPRSRKMNNDALGKDAIDKLNTEKQEKQAADNSGPTPEPEPEPEPTATITKAQFDKLMGAMSASADAAAKVPVLEKELADAKAALDAKEAEIQAAVDKVKAESEDKDGELNFLDGLFKTMGYPNPAADRSQFNANTIVTGVKMDAATAVREFDSAFKTASQGSYRDKDGFSHDIIDPTQLDRFVREHRQELRDGMEAYAKKQGLLQGARSKDAATARPDIQGTALLPWLSAEMRMTHCRKYIYHQFAKFKLDIGKGEGDSIVIGRVNRGDAPTLPSDWELTPGVPLTADRQPVGLSNVPALLKEWGMGKGTNNRPVAIPEFLTATSMVELLSIVMKLLGENYNLYEEIQSRSLWFATTKVLYNNAGGVVNTPASVAATAATAKYRSGAMTSQLLTNLYAELSIGQVPALPDGTYGITMHEKALAQYKSSLKEKNLYLERGNIEELTNMFRELTMNPNMERVSGYQGTMDNFTIFSTNDHSVGAAGTLGAQNETVGGASRITRTNFVFGTDSIGRGVGMPAQIRQQVDTDFGRMGAWSWKSHEVWAPLDVDAAVAGQQTRVYKLNTTDEEI